MRGQWKASSAYGFLAREQTGRRYFVLDFHTCLEPSCALQAACARNIPLVMRIFQNRISKPIFRLVACAAMVGAAVPPRTAPGRGRRRHNGTPRRRHAPPVASRYLAGCRRPIHRSGLPRRPRRHVHRKFHHRFQRPRAHYRDGLAMLPASTNTATSVTPVHFAIFRQQADGTMKVEHYFPSYPTR